MGTRSGSSTSASRARREPEPENRSAARVLDILDLFLDGRPCHTLTGVSELLGIPKSTAHGILHAMRRHGYLTWDPSSRTYAISLQLVGRVAAAPVMELVRTRARRRLDRLATTLGETAILIGYEGAESVAVDFVEGARALKYAVRVGRGWPLHATGGGKLYLAQFTDDEVREMLGDLDRQRVTAGTITEMDVLLAELAQVRRAGWASQHGEIIEDVSGFAAPVTDPSGRLLASIVVTGPSPRLEEEQEKLVAELVGEARALSAEIAAIGPVAAAEAGTVA